MGATEEML